jgi:hypothetical protein
MDFVERALSISPDGGTGSFELLLMLIPVLVVAVLVFRKKRLFGRQ